MLSKCFRKSVTTPSLRLKQHEKPELNPDFTRYPYGNSPIHIQGLWKIDHGYDYGSEQLDYEDHSVHMLHQRYSHSRSFWVVFSGSASIALFYYIWTEFPFTGITFGHTVLDVDMNTIRYVNDDEGYHDWEGLRKQLLVKREEDENEEDEEDEEEEQGNEAGEEESAEEQEED